MEELEQQLDVMQKLTDLKKTYEKQILALTKAKNACSKVDSKIQIDSLLTLSNQGLKRAQEYIDIFLDVYHHENFDKVRHDPELLKEVDGMIENAQEIFVCCQDLSIFVEQNNDVI